LVLGRNGPVAPRIAAGQSNAARNQPVGDLVTRTGLTLQVGVWLSPVCAPAGVEEHGVPGLGGYASPLDVLNRDDLARLQALDVPARWHVDQPPVRDDLRNGLCAEPLDAGGRGQFRDRPAVVAASTDLKVTEGIEMSA